MTDTDLSKKYFQIFLVVTIYWIVSISTVFVNKTLLGSSIIDLKAPLFITWTQCLVSTLICCIWKVFFKHSFPESDCFNTRTIHGILPLTVLFILTISLNNLSLNYVGVAFYFVSRSLTTIFNVIFSYLILRQTTSLGAIFFCLLIIFGFALGVDQENLIGTFSLPGTICGVLGSIALSLYSIHTKKVLPLVNNHVILLSFYNNLYAIILFLPVVLLTEGPEIYNYNFFNQNFWLLTAIGGVLGFLIGFVTTLQIKVTTPLTHNISGTAKACFQTVLATFYYSESKSILWWISNAIVLISTMGYARVKQLEMEQKIKKADHV